MTLPSGIVFCTISKHCHTFDVSFLGLGTRDDVGVAPEAEGPGVVPAGPERSKKSSSILRLSTN